jgi:hypothetical protein
MHVFFQGSLAQRCKVAQLEMLEFQVLHIVLWGTGLAKQLNLMSNGANVIATPLPLKNLKFMYVRSPNVVIVKTYLICSSFYACNNILVLSCGCTYQ